MIFKLQRSQLTTCDAPRILVYNEDRSITHECATNNELEQFLKKRSKMFVHGKIRRDGMLEIDGEAPWQRW